MKCKEVILEIDRLTFEKDFHLSHEVSQHINACKTCGRYHDDALKAAHLIAQKQKQKRLDALAPGGANGS